MNSATRPGLTHELVSLVDAFSSSADPARVAWFAARVEQLATTDAFDAVRFLSEDRSVTEDALEAEVASTCAMLAAASTVELTAWLVPRVGSVELFLELSTAPVGALISA